MKNRNSEWIRTADLLSQKQTHHRPCRFSQIIDFNGVMVRPSGFEPPTFCSGGKESMCILLTYMAAITCFKANRRRIKAAVDERLMKGFREKISPITAAPLLLPCAERGVPCPARRNPVCGPRQTVFPRPEGKGHYSMTPLDRFISPRTSPARWWGTFSEFPLAPSVDGSR